MLKMLIKLKEADAQEADSELSKLSTDAEIKERDT